MTSSADAALDTSFQRVGVFPNASIENAYLSYRELRTKRVIELGWRVADDLTDDLDVDMYDEFDVPTRSVVLIDDRGEAMGGGRFTPPTGPAEQSLSFSMWGSADGLELGGPEFAEFAAVHDAGQLYDVTRLVCDRRHASVGNIFSILGAGMTAAGPSIGAYFTADDRFERFMRVAGIEVLALHRGKLLRPSALLWLPPDALHRIRSLRARAMLTRGAHAFDPDRARAMPFFEPAALDDDRDAEPGISVIA